MESPGRAAGQERHEHVPFSEVRGLGTEAQIGFVLGLRDAAGDDDEVDPEKIVAKLAYMKKMKEKYLRINKKLEDKIEELNKQRFGEDKAHKAAIAEISNVTKKLSRQRRILAEEQSKLDHKRRHREGVQIQVNALRKKLEQIQLIEDEQEASKTTMLTLSRSFTPEVFDAQRQIAWFEKEHNIPGARTKIRRKPMNYDPTSSTSSHTMCQYQIGALKAW